jgi:hypothetical protein
MSRRFRRLGLVTLVATAATAIATGAALADQSYTDAGGDAGAGTDVTGITVRNDQAGNLTIQVGAASPIVANHAIAIFLNTDRNAATGGQGDEYWMYGGPLVGTAFFAWNGSDFVDANPGSFSVGAAGTNVTEFRINRADIGNVTSFDFFVLSISIDEGSAGFEVKGWDGAPEIGYFSYELAFPQCSNAKDDDGDGKIDSADLGCSSATDEDESDDPVNIRLGKAKTTPLRPKAGKTAVVSAPTTRVETGQPLDGGTVKCTGKIVGGAALKGTGTVAAGRAVCKFKIPLTAKNKQVRGQIAVTYETASAKTPFTFRTAA